MNALFLTQSRSLRMFYGLMRELREPMGLERIGFLVAHRPYFLEFTRQVPDVLSGGYYLLKEWEVTSRALAGSPDLGLIRRFEKQLRAPSLWPAIVADRRIYLGSRASFTQDYRPRFSERQMLSLLGEGLVAIERAFDEIQPHFVAGFICVTMLERLAYLFAEARGIPILNMRPTRIRNYVVVDNSIFEPAGRIRSAFQGHTTGTRDRWRELADAYIEEARAGQARYEGVATVRPERPPFLRRVTRLPLSASRVLAAEWRYRFGAVRDIHDPGVIVPAFYKRVVNPVRAWTQRHSRGIRWLGLDALNGVDYAFFPLHIEPEVALLVLSRPYLNQIEVVRYLSSSLPAGMVLAVKEHPVALGRRPGSYYRKLAAIPNVRLVDPAIPAAPLIEGSRLVVTIAGSVGWEAALRGKPAVSLGHTSYEVLPPEVHRRVTDLERLPEEIASLMGGYRHDRSVLSSFVAAVMSQSVPVNLYSTLLGRESAFALGRPNPRSEEAFREDIARLAEHVIDSYRRYAGEAASAR